MKNVEPLKALRASLWDRPYFAWAVLAVVTYLGAALRIGGIGESLWLDELHTAWTISGPLADISERAAVGNYSPVYFYLVWAVTRVAGMNEIALRLPSLVPGILLVPLAYLAVFQWTRSRAAGLTAAWLLALDVTFLGFSQEARPYALIQFLALVHVRVFWDLLYRPQRWRRAVWIVAGALLFYLHYTAVVLVLAEALAYCALVASRRGRPRYRPASFALDFALVVLACLPATGHLLEIAARRDNWKQFVDPQPWTAVLSRYPYPLAVYVYLPLVLAALVAYGRGLARLVPAVSRPDWRFVVLLLCWYAVPVGGAWVATSTDTARLLFPRYVIVASLVPILAAGVVCSTGVGRFSRIGLASLIVVAVVAAEWSGYHRGPVQSWLARGHCSTRGSEDWQGAVQYLNETAVGADHPVFVQSGLIEADGLSEGGDARLAEYCLFPVTSGVYPLATRDRVVVPLRNRSPLVADPQALEVVIERGGVWLVVRGPKQWADATLRRMEGLLRARGGRLRGVNRKPLVGLQVIHLELEQK